MSNPRNHFKNASKEAPADDKPNLFGLLQKVLRVDSIFESGLPIRYVPRLMWVTGLTLFYIGNNHYANHTIRKLQSTKIEVEELRVDFTTLKSEYMFASKQSEVARRVNPLGLQESIIPPRKIVLAE